ncbi:hypothetical protein D918_07432 [Trichuris suis]|nr:hypothetical protein D918_07432 [Trichuris suis]
MRKILRKLSFGSSQKGVAIVNIVGCNNSDEYRSKFSRHLKLSSFLKGEKLMIVLHKISARLGSLNRCLTNIELSVTAINCTQMSKRILGRSMQSSNHPNSSRRLFQSVVA